MSRKKVGLFAAGTFIVVAALAGGSTDEPVAAIEPTAIATSASPSAHVEAMSTVEPSVAAPSSTPAAPSVAPALTPSGLAGTVVEVVDGDTVRVELVSGLETVRIIGIDTPEVHHPSQPEACFGAEATDFATRILDGRSVVLEPDPTQDERDRYDRLLAHVLVGDDLYASEAIAGGFGIHYVYGVPSIHADELDAAAEAARSAKVGIWASCQGRVDLPLTAVVQPTPVPVAAPAATSKPEPTKDAGCHPSYDPCVPDAGHDLDCGDISFEVAVIGPDVYRLDGSDNDGRGCESY